MTAETEIRHGRHCVFNSHVHFSAFMVALFVETRDESAEAGGTVSSAKPIEERLNRTHEERE